MTRRGPIARNLAVLVVFGSVVWLSASGTGFGLRELFSSHGRSAIGAFLRGLFPPEVSPAYLAGLVGPSLETLRMSVTGVVVGATIAAPLTFMVARTPSAERSRKRRFVPFAGVARGVLSVLRTVPELVWALIFISAVGLGPLAGVLALAFHGAGLLGKLYAETLEAVDPGPVESLRASGAGRFGTFVWGVAPQASSNLASVTLYQWECNVRAAAILGFVGAGGIGQRLDIAMRLFRYDEVLTLLTTLLVLVTLVDNISARIRRAISPVV